MDRFLGYVERGVFQGGCFFASAEAEFGNRPGAVRDKIKAAQQEWRRGLEGLIRAAQAAGSLDPSDDATQLAFELDAYLLMGNTGFVLHNDPVYLEQARAAIQRRLGGR